MILLALWLLAAESLIKVPPADFTAIELNVAYDHSTVQGSFRVENGSRVQAIVLTRPEAARLTRGRSVHSLFTSGFSASDSFRVSIPEAGAYVLILDNRLESRFPAEVALKIEITHPQDVIVRTVAPDRQRATVALSLLFFGAVVVFSAVKFLRQ